MLYTIPGPVVHKSNIDFSRLAISVHLTRGGTQTFQIADAVALQWTRVYSALDTSAQRI